MADKNPNPFAEENLAEGSIATVTPKEITTQLLRGWCWYRCPRCQGTACARWLLELVNLKHRGLAMGARALLQQEHGRTDHHRTAPCGSTLRTAYNSTAIPPIMVVDGANRVLYAPTPPAEPTGMRHQQAERIDVPTLPGPVDAYLVGPSAVFDPAVGDEDLTAAWLGAGELEPAAVYECPECGPAGGEYLEDGAPMEATIVAGGTCPHCEAKLVQI